MVCIFKVRIRALLLGLCCLPALILSTMRPWLLLLASLLVSDLSPLGDRDWIMENHSWSLRRKPLLNGQMTPLGLEILQTQTEHHCMCIQRKCVHVAVQHKQRTSPFYWAYTVHDAPRHSLSHQEFTGIIHRNHIPAAVCSFQSVLVWLCWYCTLSTKCLFPCVVFPADRITTVPWDQPTHYLFSPFCIFSVLLLPGVWMNYQHSRWDCHILQDRTTQKHEVDHYTHNNNQVYFRTHFTLLIIRTPDMQHVFALVQNIYERD